MTVTWLIEKKAVDEQVSYLTVYLGELVYTADLDEALQFAREQGAVTMLEHEFFVENLTTLTVINLCTA